ncbi:hypothetical protein K505DRAFT_279086 [Melanomma pulvis-pyrius CBS 109.77]|uniref:Uncharacterized protein n=1 Tax=Melanomma pulvis-pyrius CBS 109.77 TaxID=1314802 RepID=A0A6A6X831_9PLEO|nr:hypothetical protein K505DRAFT_279086 [Melanomma pulvis-pyrius CBS 109.77]
MDPLSALGACSSILQIVDFSCKILSKGNQLRTSFSGALPENEVLEKVTTHLHGLVDRLRRQGQIPNGQDLNGMIVLCIGTAGELLDVLDRLRVHGPKTRWKSFRAAIKSVWRKEKVDEILGRLQLIKDEIEFGVILDLREVLVGLSAQQSTRFNTLDQSTQAVLQAVLHGQSVSTAASNTQSRAIDDMNVRLEKLIINEHQQTRNEILDELRQQNAQASTSRFMPPYMPQIDPNQNLEKTDILVMLKFQAIDDRHSAIPENHRQTFEWLWLGRSRSDQTWGNFWQWLTMDQGIYWISGKAGSGKSTLMKYVYHDDRTSQGLQHWSNGTEVVKAGFFFWNSGSSMQNSLLGLLQSILYDILDQKRELKEVVFPADVQNEVSERWKSRSPDSETIWTIQDLKDAFVRLLQTPNLKICLFIDGLDEYDGDHNEIAELFKGILASPSVKACLSSRPLVTFERSFSACPRLRLQDLTYEDINLYVREKLEGREEVLRMSLAEPSDFQELVEGIIMKASGVFLWVTLAVRSLLEGLGNYDRMADLRFRLKEIPDDLSHLYWHMLRSIKPTFYFAQAAKLLRIVYTAYSEKINLSPEDLAIAEEYEPGTPLRSFSREAYRDYINAQAVLMGGRLMSRCRGLLELQQGRVSFLHLSVLEFLGQPDVERSLNEKIQDPFNPYSSLLAATLTDVENREVDQYNDQGQARVDLVLDLARKAEEESGTADTVLTNEIDRVFSKSYMKQDSCVTVGAWNWRQSGLSWAGIPAHRDHPRPYAWNDTFVSLCLQRGLHRYVAAILDTGEPMKQGPEGRPLLDFVIDYKCIYFWTKLDREPKKVLEACRMLLERGANTNEMFLDMTVWERLLSHVNGDIPFRDATEMEMSAVPVGGHESYHTDESSHGTMDHYTRLMSHWIWAEIMKLFLEFGADPNAGVTDHTFSSFDEIKPVTSFVLERFFPSDRKRGTELYNKLRSLGGLETAYRRPTRPKPNSLMWDLLPEPIPGALTNPRPLWELNDFTPKVKRNVIEYPDYEGMIPVWTESILTSPSQTHSHSRPPSTAASTPVHQQTAPKRSIYSQLMVYANRTQHNTVQPNVEQPSPLLMYTEPYQSNQAPIPIEQVYQPLPYGSSMYQPISVLPEPPISAPTSSSPAPHYSQPLPPNINLTPPIQQPYPQQGYTQQAYPQQAYPQQAYPQQAYPQQVYPQQVYPQQVYPQQVYATPPPSMYYQTTQPIYHPPMSYVQPYPNPSPTPYHTSAHQVSSGHPTPQPPQMPTYLPSYHNSAYVPPVPIPGNISNRPQYPNLSTEPPHPDSSQVYYSPATPCPNLKSSHNPR